MSLEQAAARQTRGVVVFYVLFVVMFAAEGALVHGIRYVATAIGIGSAGTSLAWLVFIVGGAALGFYELHAIEPERKLRDPILRLCCHCYDNYGVAGYLFDALLIGAAPGTAVAARHANSPRATVQTMAAAVLFATLWVPVYAIAWR